MDGLAGRIAAVLDDGACSVGVESTVVDLTGPRPLLLRPGGLAREAIEQLIGPVDRGIAPGQEEAAAPRSPGLLTSHYAPSLPVRLDAVVISHNEALLAFGAPLPGAGATFQLSAGKNLQEAAANLFAGLRALDREGAGLGLTRIAVMPVPDEGLGLAINDRLQRAAAPRI
jgi:L-threonylcarbamoyladenylate synthase